MKNEDGYALVLSFVMLVVLMIILYAMVSLVSSEIDFVSHAENSTKAFYIAEAGLEYANSLINDDTKWEDNNGDDIYNFLDIGQDIDSALSDVGNLVSVTKSGGGSSITLTSEGEYNGVTKKIKATYLLEPNDTFSKYSIAASSSMTLGNKIEIVGSDSNGDGVIDSGDVYSTSVIDDLGAIYEPTEIQLLENQSEPVVPDMYNQVFAKLDENADGSLSDEGYETKIDPDPGSLINHDFPGPTEADYDSKKVLFIDNNKTSAFTPDKNSTLSGSGILLVDGDLTFPEGFGINTETGEQMLIIVNGSVQFNNAVTFNGMVYASEEVRLNNSVNITGGVFSDFIVKENKDSVDVVTNAKITHSSEYMQIFSDVIEDNFVPTLDGELSYKAEIVEWEEL